MTTLYNSEVESLEECGRRIIGELWEAYRKEQRTVIDGEVDIKEFRWRSHLVHWENIEELTWTIQRGALSTAKSRETARKEWSPK